MAPNPPKTPPEPAEHAISRGWHNAAMPGLPRSLHLNPSVRALCLTLTLVLVAAGCNSSNPSPSRATHSPTRSSTPTATPTSAPSDEAAIYAEIEAKVEAIRGLRAKQSLVPTLLDEASVRAYLTQAFDSQVDPAQLALQEAVYKHLGLLPASASLRKLEIDIQSSQVIGFYDDATKQLYLVSNDGKVGALQKATFSHEFAHALQDQNFGLDKLALDTADQGDRDLARLAAVEGDASLVMQKWAETGLSFTDLAELLGAANGPQQQELDKAPAVLRQTLMFPYVQGLAFVQQEQAAGGWDRVDSLYARPPASTSQILHPELYDQNVQPIPVTVPPAPSGWKLAAQDTLGEFQLGVWLAGEKPTADRTTTAFEAVSQWGGDRLGLYQGPNGRWAVVIRTVWRTGQGRTAFRLAAGNAPRQAGSVLSACTVGNLANVVVASDAYTAALFDCGRG